MKINGHIRETTADLRGKLYAPARLNARLLLRRRFPQFRLAWFCMASVQGSRTIMADVASAWPGPAVRWLHSFGSRISLQR